MTHSPRFAAPSRWVALAFIALIGCGEPSGVDAGPIDAGAPDLPEDGGGLDSSIDAGAPLDAGADAGGGPCGAGPDPRRWVDVATRVADGEYTYVGPLDRTVDLGISTCGFSGYPEAAFSYTPEMDGVLYVSGPGVQSSFGSYVSIRSQCSDVASELACSDFMRFADPNIAVRVEAGTTLYLVIEGRIADGPLEMSTRLVPSLPEGAVCDPADLGLTCAAGLSCDADACAAQCGDGAVQLGEACDDGQRADGDGCSADCAHETQGPGSAACAAAVDELVLVPVGPGRFRAWAAGDTRGAPTPETVSCSSAVGDVPGPAPAAAYRVWFPPNSRVVPRIIPESGFHPVLLLVDEPCNGRGLCYDPGDPGDVAEPREPLETAATTNEAYILVTGAGDAASRAGRFLLTVDVEPR